ncbi:MAG TPA: DUF805 domain-containing protein [Ramlibacter sp.]|nr:DUF805 domain-containing protein [Ramlibacter sp.]
MDFKQAVSTCLEKYVDFTGRGGRSEYWWFALFSIALSIVAMWLLGSWIAQLVNLALLLPSLAVGTRRLHDMGKSGWFQLIWLVPFFGWILLVYWLVQPTVGPNEYGSGPAQPNVPSLPPGAM